jgi:small subunit ribosomal protein S16
LVFSQFNFCEEVSLAVKIRLMRMGRKKRPFYRIVVTDTKAPRDGRYVECIGTYDSLPDPPKMVLNDERVHFWLDRGAIPSDTVRSLFRRKGLLFLRALKRKGLDPEKIEEELKKWEVRQMEKSKRELEKRVIKAKAKKEKAKEEKAKEETGPVVQVASEAEAQSESGSASESQS